MLARAPRSAPPPFSDTLDSTTVSSGSVTDPVLDIDVSLNAIFDPDE